MSGPTQTRTRPIRTALAAMTGALAAVARGAEDAYQIYHPVTTPSSRHPSDKGISVRDLELVTSRDNIRLHGWVAPGRGPHTVVIAHGTGRDKAMVIDHIRLLHGAGHHVVAVDLRNHGRSGARPGVAADGGPVHQRPRRRARRRPPGAGSRRRSGRRPGLLLLHLAGGAPAEAAGC
jgi:pimeloyl-ACP methyl ester carboxylesterase